MWPSGYTPAAHHTFHQTLLGTIGKIEREDEQSGKVCKKPLSVSTRQVCLNVFVFFERGALAQSSYRFSGRATRSIFPCVSWGAAGTGRTRRTGWTGGSSLALVTLFEMRTARKRQKEKWKKKNKIPTIENN